jgi:magnesium transporter
VLRDEAIYIDGLRHEIANRPGHERFGTAPVATLNGHASDVPDGAFAWIGLVDPTPIDMQRVGSDFNLSPLVIEDALATKQRPKLDIFTDVSCLLLKTLEFDLKSKQIVTGDVAIVFGKNFVVTVRHGDSQILRGVRHELESDPARLKYGPTCVVHAILDKLVDQYLVVGSHLHDESEEVEDSVFDESRATSGKQLYMVKHEVLEFKRATEPLIEPLHKIVAGQVAAIDSACLAWFSDVQDHLRRAIDEANSLNELINAALQANLTFVQVQQNTDVRKISAWAAIAAAPTLIASIYGMNFPNMPEMSTSYGYGVIMTLMVGSSVSLFFLLRKKGWL